MNIDAQNNDSKIIIAVFTDALALDGYVSVDDAAREG